MHERTHGPARAHALTRNIPTRTCATPRSSYTRHSTFENRQPSPHTHVHSKNLHARTHGRAHSHARTHEIRHVHGDTHTARTRNIRTRKCTTPGSTYTRHSTCENGQPSRRDRITQGTQAARAVAPSLPDTLADCARQPAQSHHRFSMVENRPRRSPAPTCVQAS